MARVLDSLVGILVASGMAATAFASPREDSLATFDRLLGPRRDGVEVWVNEHGVTEVGVGEAMDVHFRSESDGFLTVLYLDSGGAVTVLFPTADPEQGRIRRGVDRSLSDGGAEMPLEAEAPIGIETILAVVTAEPIRLRDLGLSPSAQRFPVVAPAQVERLATGLARELASRGAAGAMADRFDLRVVQRLASAAQPPYTSRGIVGFFTEQTRSVERRPLDLQIHFDFGSDELTDAARRNLDEVGSALRDPALRRERFALAGHTDDVGQDAFNQALSEQRAEAARRYLVAQHGIERERLVARGFGEAVPVVLGQSETARAANRRVELGVVR